MKGKVKCSGCGHSWNKSDSSEKDMYICHKCGKDNVMKDGGWLNKYDDGSPGQENYNDSSVEVSENFVGLGYNTKGRNYSPAWGGQFQDGGELSPLPLSQQITSLIPKDTIEPTVPYTTAKDPAKFYKSWIENPEFEKRQLLTGYTGSPKKKYETDPIASEVRNIRLGSLDNIDPITYSSRQPSKATPGYYGSSSYVNINPSDYTGTSREAILAHELAHIGGATNLIGGMSSMEQDIFRDAMLPLKKPVISGVQDSEERNASIRNLEDFMHSQKPYEAKADLDALRFMMYDKGIYDITKGKKFTEKDFEKAKENLGKDRVFKRLTDRVGKKNFVNLMNTIASADEEIIPIAQNGASMPGSVGFTYARTIDPAPSNGPYAKKTKASAQGGKDIDRVSTSDPRYAELYKNRQVGSFYDGAYNLPDLPEFVVEGKDERVKEAMARTSQGFLQGVLNTLSAPQEVTMDLLTGKQQTPSEAFGFQSPGGWLDSPTSFGKNLSNFAMDAVLDPMNLVGVGAADDVLKLGLKNIPQKAGKALGTESGLLSNAWKLNPKAYQYNLPENTMFRGIGKEGMEDATQSGVFRPRVLPKPSVPDESGIRLSPKIFDKTYYSPDFKIADKYGKDYIAEVPKTSADFTRRYSNKDWSYHTNRQIPIEEGRILQKDWLQGYKEVPKQLTSSVDDVGKSFKSEIDWSKWNPDTPKYPELINEYNAIEESTKKAGTWMKNPDGSVFKGTPEQFVQQQSSYFKKAFPNPVLDDMGNVQLNYHGSPNKFTEFDESKFYSGYFGKGVYTSPDKEAILKSYANPKKRRTNKIAEITKNADYKEGEANLYELYINSKNPKNYDDILDSGEWIGDIEDFGKNVKDLPSLQEWKKSHKEFLDSNSFLDSDEKILSFMNNTGGKSFKVKENFKEVLPNVDFLKIPSTPLQEQVTPFSNRLKSAVGNVGFFDMTNPNIYKALVPSGIATSLAINQQRNGGNTSYAQNGQEMRFYQNGLDWKPKSMQDGGVQKTSEEIKKEQEEIKKARETAFRTIQPSSYDDLKNMGRWMFNIQRETYDDPRSEEFWKNYLKQPGELQYLKPSQYKPTISKNKDVNYYSVDNELEKAIFDSFKDKLEIKEIKKANESDISGKYNTDTLQNFVISNPGLGDRNPSGSIARALGNFTVSKGMDDRGEYISYYDTYDFPEWIQNKVKGEPYEIYGRIYYPNEENNKRNGGIVKDNDGYLNPNNFGKVVEIDSNNITMEGVYEPLLGISDTGDTKLMQPGKNYKFKGSKVTEFPIRKANDGIKINDEDVEIPRDKYVTKMKEYDNFLKLNNYTTPYYKDNNIDTSDGDMNCINGVCYMVSNLTGVKFDKAQTKDTYTGNATFADNAMDEGFYRYNPEKEGFGVGDIFQYARKKGSYLSRFPGDVNFKNEKDLYPNHAVLIVDEYDKDGTKYFKIANNSGKDKVELDDVSESELMNRYKKGYKTFHGGITYRYDPDKVVSIRKENKNKVNVLKGRNPYAGQYSKFDNSNLTFFNNKVEGLNIKDELVTDKNLQRYADVYKTVYSDLGKGSNMPIDSFNKLIMNQVGIAGQETKFGELASNSKDLVPDSILPYARRAREIYNYNFGTEDNWKKDYWDNNADNIQKEFSSYKDFVKSFDSEDSDYNPYRTPRSIGVFQQKDLSERGKFYKYDLDSFEGQVKSSLALAVDNYHKLKDKYPNLSEDQIIDLTTLMHNAPGKALEPRFVNYYLKRNDVDYIDKVKEFAPKSFGKDQPKDKKVQWEAEQIFPEKTKSIVDYVKSLPKTKRNGGDVGINDLDAQPMKKLNQLTNFTNNPDKTNWLEKYN